MTEYQNWRYTNDLSIFDGLVMCKESLIHLIVGHNLADVRSYAGGSCGIRGKKIVLDFL